MISRLEWIILLIVFIVIFTWIFYLIYPTNLTKNIESNENDLISLENFMRNADNGDLVFFSGKTYGDNICKFFSSSYYSHVGMLVREIDENGKNVLYIWDADIGQGMKPGPRLQPVSDKIKRYSGHKYMAWKKIKGNRPKTLDILKIVMKYKNYEQDTVMGKWIFDFFPRKDKHIFCSELIALTLQQLGILPDDFSPYNYSPQNLYDLKKNYNIANHISMV